VKQRSPRDYKEFLRGGRWFHGLPDALQERLLAIAVLRELQAGERLFSRGDPPSGLYAVLDGDIRVFGLTESGKEAVLTLLEPPAWFGEIAVFDRQPRTHDAIAEKKTLLVEVPQDPLLALLDGEPRWWHQLGLLVAGKLRLTLLAMEESAILPIPVRLARRILRMVEGYGEREHELRTVQVTQDQLASMLASSRQTVNGLLKDLEARGVIRLAYGTIEIVDLPALRKAAT
jgi:CRP/FNR family cyclic AMP-dependent transcriptional regulator